MSNLTAGNTISLQLLGAVVTAVLVGRGAAAGATLTSYSSAKLKKKGFFSLSKIVDKGLK
ncbi:hypothetical protein ACSLGF_10035 [Bacillus sp. A015]